MNRIERLTENIKYAQVEVLNIYTHGDRFENIAYTTVGVLLTFLEERGMERIDFEEGLLEILLDLEDWNKKNGRG